MNKLLNSPYSCTFVFQNIGSRYARNLKLKVYMFSENNFTEYIGIKEGEVSNIIHPGANPACQVGIVEFKGLDVNIHYFYLTFEYTDIESGVNYRESPYYLKWLGLKEGKGTKNFRHVSSQEILDAINKTIRRKAKGGRS